MTLALSAQAPPTQSTKRHAWAFRPDIEGLRAIAILLVVLYHAHLSAVRGGYLGVDVFFVLSGFLITGVLLDEVATTGRVSLMNFWARRARRLLPAGTVILVVVLAADAAFFTPFEELRHAHTARSFGVYASNILFAARSTDYFAGDTARDPLLHTWSLSVEEQFYLIYAPFVALLALRARGVGRFTRLFRNASVFISLVSFAGCLALRRLYPVIAFYVLPARAWEFGLGALTVIAVKHLPPRRFRHDEWISALSLLALVASGMLATDHAAHPGWITLIPTLGTVGLIISSSRGMTTTGAVLSSPPLRLIGRLSYSWYLWHWPFLVFFAEIVPHPAPNLSLLVACASLVPAAATYYLIEKPVRFAKVLQRRSLLTVVGAVIIAAMTVSLATVAAAYASARLKRPEFAAFVAARTDLPRPYADGCHVSLTSEYSPVCSYGAIGSDTIVVLFGDSHAAEWFPALEQVAMRRHWRLVSLTKSACPSALVTVGNDLLGRAYSECDRWRQRALARIDSLRPAIVVLSNARIYTIEHESKQIPTTQVEGAVLWGAGLGRSAGRIARSAEHVVVFQDTPRPGFDIPECLVRNFQNVRVCTFRRQDGVDDNFAAHERAGVEHLDRVTYLDLNDHICTGEVCPAVTDGLVRYEDDNHVTKGFSERLAPVVSDELSRIIRGSPAPAILP